MWRVHYSYSECSVLEQCQSQAHAGSQGRMSVRYQNKIHSHIHSAAVNCPKLYFQPDKYLGKTKTNTIYPHTSHICAQPLTHAHTHTHSLHKHTCTHARVRTHTHTHNNTRTHIRMPAHPHTPMHAHMHTHTHKHTHTNTHTRTHAHTHTYTHTHTHTHAHT